MKKKLRVGIAGCGAIGSSLAGIIKRDFSSSIVLAALYDRQQEKAITLSQRLTKGRGLAVVNLSQVIKLSDLVIECAQASAAFRVAKAALSGGSDVMIMSAGGVLDKIGRVRRLARRNQRRVYLPSGAICGLDALKAIEPGQIKKVVLTTIKNPLSFKGVKYAQKKLGRSPSLKKDKVIFYGSAKDAVRLFPQNINVAAILSISGIGPEKTKVRIIASPAVEKNTHQLSIESVPANITTMTENVLHPDNPKTSYLAVLSAKAVLRQIVEPVRVGT